MKPVYAFDIDGVLCSTKEVHRAALEAELGGVTLHDGGHYDAFGFHHDSDEILEELRRIAMDLWRRPTVFANGEASGQGVLRQLEGREQLAGYVTRRHPDLEWNTRKWLIESDMPTKFRYDGDGHQYLSIHPLHHMLGDVDSKAAPAREMGADTLVEDSPHEALLAARDGLNVVVLRVPYNKDFEQQCKLGRLTNATPSDPDYLTYFRIRFISALQELL